MKTKATDKQRHQEVIGFLAAKGFLYSPQKERSRKMTLSNALYVGENLEPRVLEVLPAALLRVKTGIVLDVPIPKDLHAVLVYLKQGKTNGPCYHHAPYRELLRWANLNLPDQRTKPQKDKKICKSFRLSPEAIKRLRELSTKDKCTETDIVERLLFS